MSIYITLLFFSGAGGAVIIIRNFLKVRYLTQREQGLKYHAARSFFGEIEKHFVIPLKNFWETRFIPVFYKKIEKISGWFRIYILKFENKIFKFNSYIRGKRIIKENGNASDYMQKLNGFKKEENDYNEK